ncbi:MAG TPA: PAS domain-containing protein [Verrucomicrobiae bacterium]|jgi:PAS domain S-box-containing protein|nr:PAS domain-containing protein [Verrucomicrobiae bacterium]
MTQSFKDFPIQRKMLLLTLMICGAVLLAAAAAMFLFQIVNFRYHFQRDTATLGGIIAKNSTAALAFGDRRAAGEILSSLNAKPSVLYACLVTPSKTVIAEFGDPRKSLSLDRFPDAEAFRFVDGNLLFTLPIKLENKTLGTLYLCQDYHHGFYELLRLYSLMLIGVLIASGILAAFLSGRLHRVITNPILSLGETARRVGENNDYSVRSSAADRADEVGVLARAFNGMLSRIESQDRALTLSQQKLKGLVNSLDGVVWERDPEQFAFTYASRQSEHFLGYPAEEWIANPHFWSAVLHPEDRPGMMTAYRDIVRKQEPYSFEYRVIAADGRELWVRESGLVALENDKPLAVRGIFQEITAQKQAAVELEKLNRQLVTASRQAGMAEVATGVLHNVGNVLNSVNVSASLLKERLHQSEVRTLNRVAGLMEQQNGNLVPFLTDDPRGKLIPGFVVQIAHQLKKEQDFFATELTELGKNIDHIKEIVSMQQSYARLGGVLEKVSLANLIEDALRMNAAVLTRANIEVIRDFLPVPPIIVDNHKVLQILINLIRNAKFAMENSPVRQLTLSLRPHEADRVQVIVRDTGVGISAENLTRIFAHGFTTRKEGHGFGLHIGALNAKQMGGFLTVNSEGEGKGATFTLDLPIEPAKEKNL